MQSFFTDIEAKKQIINLYYKKLHELQIPYEFITVETSFGDTNVIVTGNLKNPPLILVHDAQSCAPIALEQCKDLLTEFRIYAIDILGQPNLSAEIQLPLQNDAYGRWMYEILSRLHLLNAILVGISFGGYITLKTLAFDQTRIQKAFLITPTGIIKGTIVPQFFKVLLPLKMYQWKQSLNYLKTYTAAISDEDDNEFRLKFMSKVICTYNTTIPLIHKKEAEKIQIPLYLVTVEKEVFYSNKKLIKKAKNMFSSLKKIILIQGAKHIPSKKDQQKIAKFIIETCKKDTKS